MRGEIRFRNRAVLLFALLFTLAVCPVGCGRGGRERTEGEGGSPSTGWRGTGGGTGSAGIGGRSGAGGTAGVAGAAGGSGGGGQDDGGGAGAPGGVAGASGDDSGGSGGQTGGAGASGGAAGKGGAGASGGAAGNGGSAAGSGGNQVDSGIDTGRNAGPIGCVYCGPGTVCAYAIADGCNAVGTCVPKPAGSPCWAIIGAVGCGCDGRDVEWQDGCMPDLPDGYAPKPIVNKNYCP